MEYRVYSETRDEIVKNTKLQVILDNKSEDLLLIRDIINGWIIFTKCTMIPAHECLYLNKSCGGHAVLLDPGSRIISNFSEDEHNHILKLYEESIDESYHYLKKRYVDIITCVCDVVEHTKPIIRIKSAQCD